MAKADKAPIVMYRAFCPSAGQSSVAQGRDWGAIDVSAAARIHVVYLWRHSGWRTESWPVPVYVHDPSKNQSWEVLVHCRFDPVFEVMDAPRFVQ
jgi:hypothetical protein